MNILLLGAGNIGKSIAYELTKDHAVTVGDKSEERLDDITDPAGTVELDASDQDELVQKMKGFDLIVSALPGRYGYDVLKAAAKAVKDIVDVSFMPEDPFTLDDEMREAGISAVVDAGFGPGLSNVFVGNIDEEMDTIEDIDIKIGGLPEKAEPPLYYRSTWSTEDLLQEYTRAARMIRDGEEINIDPLSEIDEVELHGEQFEEFYSDGLRTLLRTVEAQNMEETTLRWEGHLEKMQVLKELGFLDEENVDQTKSVIRPHMEYDSDDFSIMEVKAKGKRGKEDIEIRYHLYDEEGEMFSSMARVTGFTTAITAKYVLEKNVSVGIISPERLGREKEFHDYVISELRESGVEIQRESSILG